MSEIDMEEMSFLGDHDIVGVSITDSENIRSDAVPRTTELEVLDVFLELLFIRTVRLQEHHDRFAD